MTEPIDPIDPNATARYDAPGTIAPPTPAAQPSPTEAPRTAQSGWSTPPGALPAWRPPATDHGHIGSIVMGLVLVGVGLWFFADVSLDLELPRISWSQLWPVFIIAIGAWIALGSMRRGSR
ncbi:MAG: LiaI-LiaF-like domain-containing protein [Candidatus Limnocylindrales bacterium]